MDFDLPQNPILTFESGQTTGSTSCVTVSITDDSFVEDAETFNASLTPVNDQPVVIAPMSTISVEIPEDPADSKIK